MMSRKMFPTSYFDTVTLTICLSIGEVTVTSNDSDVMSQVTSLPNDLDHLLVSSIDVISISNFYY